MAKLSSTQIYGDLKVDGEIKNKATTTTEGVVQLNDNVNSTSTTEGATANAVKKVNDALATHKTDTTSHVTSSERSTWNGKASTAVATTSANGLMSKEDKTKLNGVATGANNYVHPGSGTNPHGTTKSDVGLGNVNNWGATTAVNSTSTTTYATASAVKQAYDLGNGVKLANGTDMNTIASNGKYIVYTKVNAPFTPRECTYMVLVSNDGTVTNQLAVLMYDSNGAIAEASRTFTRTRYNSTWDSWNELYSMKNKPTASQIGAIAMSHNIDYNILKSTTHPYAYTTNVILSEAQEREMGLPNVGYDWWYIEYIPHVNYSAGYSIQRATNLHTGTLYTRYAGGTTWTSWRRVHTGRGDAEYNTAVTFGTSAEWGSVSSNDGASVILGANLYTYGGYEFRTQNAHQSGAAGIQVDIFNNDIVFLRHSGNVGAGQVIQPTQRFVFREIDALKSSVSSGKTAVANAITAKGVSTATNAEFATMASNIGKIQTIPNNYQGNGDYMGSPNIFPATATSYHAAKTLTTALFGFGVSSNESVIKVFSTTAPIWICQSTTWRKYDPYNPVNIHVVSSSSYNIKIFNPSKTEVSLTTISGSSSFYVHTYIE